MGTPLDMEIRGRIRVDNRAHRRKILKARRAIFKDGANINSMRVKRLLQDESLVPTIVSTHYLQFNNTNVSFL